MLKILTKSDKKQQNFATNHENAKQKQNVKNNETHIIKKNSIVNTINYKNIIMKWSSSLPNARFANSHSKVLCKIEVVKRLEVKSLKSTNAAVYWVNYYSSGWLLLIFSRWCPENGDFTFVLLTNPDTETAWDVRDLNKFFPTFPILMMWV